VGSHPNSGLIVVDGVEFNDTGIISTSLLLGPYCKGLPEDQVITGCYYHQFLHYNLYIPPSGYDARKSVSNCWTIEWEVQASK
jgi:hypothetical protein